MLSRSRYARNAFFSRPKLVSGKPAARITGVVVGDWNGHAQIPGCTNSNCPQALLAGLDIYMVPDDAKALHASLLAQVKDGTIVLLHDMQGNSKTVEALKTIIPTLKDEGYEFVTVSELFEAKGIEISGDDRGLYTFVEEKK